MLTKTGIIVDTNKIIECLPTLDIGKHDLSEPTGDFFYDPWKLKLEYAGTELETLFNCLDHPGQVRVNVLEQGHCYQQHADIDDRYHVSLDGAECYLIDLTNGQMFPTTKDHIVYVMDASRLHSAANFGFYPRQQLVIRKLLKRNQLKDPISVALRATPVPRLRYNFDQTFSVWFNKANKIGIITNFNKRSETHISFDVESEHLNDVYQLIKHSGLPIELVL